MALILIAPDTDGARDATFTGSSEQEGYEAANAGTDDPSEPWWAASGSASLTVTFTTQTVSAIALHMTNADDGATINITGGTTASLTASRNPSGHPVDLVHILSTPTSMSSLTFTIAGNSVPWSIGRVAFGGTTIDRHYLQGDFTYTPMRMQFSDENDYGHDIRYDLGVECHQSEGSLRLYYPTDLADLDAVWSACRGGYYPITAILNVVNGTSRFPPMFCRMTKSLPRTDTSANFAKVDVTLREVSRGLEPV
jgi:hypothetical protein